MKKVFSLCVVVCFACLCFSCGSSGRGGTPTEVVQSFYQALGAEDYETAVGCMFFEEEGDRAMMLEMLKGFIGPQMKKLGGLTPSNFSEKPAKNEGEIEVVFDLTDGRGKTKPDHAVCLRDADGNWRLRPINN